MVAADQAADSLHRLKEFEELFRNRYTEFDRDYKKTAQEGQRLTNVPVMSPWPPRNIRRGKFKGRERNRRNDRGANSYFYRRDHSDYSHSRNNDRQPYSDSRLAEDYNPSSHSGVIIDYDRDESLQLHSHESLQLHSHESQSSIDHSGESKMLLDSFKDSPAKPPTESDVKAILEASSNASTFKSKNLKMEQSRKTKKSNAKKSKHKNMESSLDSTPFFSRIPLKSSTRGQTESMTASLILSEFDKTNSLDKPQKNKRKHSSLEEDKNDSESEHVDVEGDYEPQIGSSSLSDSVKRPFYASSVHKSPETLPLVVRLPLKQVSIDHPKWETGEGFEHSRSTFSVNTSDANENIQEVKKQNKPKKRKKHRHKKSSGDKQTVKEKESLTLKFSFEKFHND